MSAISPAETNSTNNNNNGSGDIDMVEAGLMENDNIKQYTSDAININTTNSAHAIPALIGSPPLATAPSYDATTNNSFMPPSPNGGITTMQSSPPPHSYRHSRAYRHFKNPPQPHMCIRTTTADTGEELFINVLSWTRIVIPQEPSDPIPLYGGMRVPPGSPRSPPIVFAVMANPEVLKDSGRHSKDPEERRAMVELMCDFVEAMNVGVKLVRNAVILKDRDISGELKDVWNAVQAQRDREREEQMLQQRQQQHYHNVTTQQMFPKTCDGSQSPNRSTEEMSEIETNSNENNIPTTMISDNKIAEERRQTDDENFINNTTKEQNDNADNQLQQNGVGIISSDQIDAISKLLTTTELTSDLNTINASSQIQDNPIKTTANSNNKSNTNTNNVINNPTTAVSAPQPPPPTTKKEKLGGFLPNGCIFPRFKNNKHKDKEKEPKVKDKEKTLLNALKKNKDKKIATNIEHNNEKTSPESDAKTQYEKNCINLENEVQKMDLNKIDTTANNDNMFIKLKVTATSAK